MSHLLTARLALPGFLMQISSLSRHSPSCATVDFSSSQPSEGGGGKIKLLNAGAYRDQGADVSFCSHPTGFADVAISRTAAFAQFHVEYFGKEAHAADRPWDGVS